MPVSYEVQHDRRLIVSRFSGEITLQDVLEHRTLIRADPEYSPDYDQLIEFNAVTRFLDADQLRELAGHLVRDSDSLAAKRAFVAADNARYGMLRMLGSLAGGSTERWRTFRTTEEAEAWLSVP